MTPIPVPHRWLAALLGVALLLDTSNVLTGSPTRTLLALPGAALFAVCAWVGVNRPAAGATFGAITLVLSSLLLRSANIDTPSIGLAHIMLTELISGVVLVVIVVWRCAPTVAFSCVPALVVACVASMIIRQPYCDWDAGYCTSYSGSYLVDMISPRDVLQSMFFGFVLLVGAIGTGYYLRRSSRQRVETELGALVRKQWPLGAALAVIALVELTDVNMNELLSYAASIGAGVCAFFGPKYPLRNTLLAAGALLFAAITGFLYTDGGNSILPFTGMAAGMALIAYVVRFVELRQAAWSTAALAVTMLLAMSARTNNGFTDEDLGLLLAFLLLVSIGTGWYFRGRDRERNQTVAAAVTSAQQGERMALARELHDVVAHHVTGIVVQAQAALMVAGTNPGVALPALEKIERSGTEALTAMRTLVGSLRDGTAAWTAGSADATGDATTDLVADIRALVENFAGPPVEVEMDLPSQLPHEMGRSVLRLVQESLTNVGKHAPDATAVHVRVAAVDDTLHVRVSDDGTKRPVNPAGGSGGYGLVGMRERVELLGGRFEAGPSGYVGWNVEAWLPMRKEES